MNIIILYFLLVLLAFNVGVKLGILICERGENDEEM